MFMIEFESKFKPAYENSNEYKKDSVMRETYIQSYFVDDDGEAKRVRIHTERVDLRTGKKMPDMAVLCVKSLVDVVDGIEIRDEVEEPMEIEAAQSIALNNLATTLVKTRNFIPFHGYTLEVDTYPESIKIDEDMKDKEGVLTAIEVEFKSKEDRDEFLKLEMPSWIGEEISSDKRYSNRKLADSPKINSFVEDYVRKYAGQKIKKKMR